MTDGYVSVHCHAQEDTRLHAKEIMDDIHLNKTFREADGLGIKPEDGQNPGHNSAGQANVHNCQYAQEMVHGLMEC